MPPRSSRTAVSRREPPLPRRERPLPHREPPLPHRERPLPRRERPLPRRERALLLVSSLAGGVSIALFVLRLASLRPGNWLVLAGAAGLVAASGTGDVERLIERVERVGRGDYDVSFELDRDDELGQLADALDEMVDRIDSRETDLEREIAYTEDVLDAIDDIFYVLDREGAYRQWNDTIAAVTGYDPGEIASMGPLDYFEGEARATIEAAIEEALEEGHTRVEASLQTKAGEEIPYEWIATRLTAPDGTPVVAGIGRDVSDRVETEQRLREREQRLERYRAYTDAILDSIDDVFYVVGPDFSFQRWNRSLREATGYDDEEIAAMHPVEFVVEEDRDTIVDAVQEVFETGSARAEARVLTRDGEEIPYEFLASKLEDPEGNPVLVGVGRDVSDRVERERELRRQASLLDSLFEQVPVNVYVKDEAARHVRTSAPYLREDAPDEEWFVGRTDLEIYEGELAEETYADDRRVIDTGEPIIEKEEYDGRSDEWLLTSKVPWRDEDGEIRGLIGVSQDITEQKERQQVLEHTEYLLRQAQEIAHVGGWELDLGTDPPTFDGTEEFRRIHGIDPEETIDLDRILEFYHPEDREYIQELLTEAIEEGTSYDMEVRLSTTGGGERWIRAIAEPVTEDGEVVALRGSVQDITDRKEQELTLEALHDVARDLLEADSPGEIATLVRDAADTVLGLPCLAVYLLDEDAGQLEPLALSESFEAVCADPDAGFDAEGDSVVWDAYVGGEVVSFDGPDAPKLPVVAGALQSCLLVPIGEYGVFLAASEQHQVTAADRRVAETLVASMETALHRIESEAALRANQTQLEAQNRRLRRQIQITEIIRRVDRSIVGASTREAIESAVCEHLVESDDVAFAWIGALDDRGAALVPRTWAGTGHEYLDAISLETDAATPDPAVRVATTGEPTVVESVVEAVTREPWRKHALVHEFSSALAVPLAYEEYRYGVLAVYGTEPGSFGQLEQTVFEELGESIANAINAVEARRALYADEFVELRLRFDGDADFLGRVAAASGATVEYVGLATHAEDESRLFFETSDADPAAVRTALEDRHAVRAFRRIGEGETPALFEATVAGTVLAATLVSRGGVPRSMTASEGQLSVVVDVPTTTDVREFLETLRERYASVELVARQNVHRDVQTRQELVAGLFDGLTERQLEVLRTAFYAGFFEWPRESTGEEVADLLDVSQPTVNRHLRHGLARLLRQLFEEEPTALAPA